MSVKNRFVYKLVFQKYVQHRIEQISETLAILKPVGNSFNSIDLLKITAKCSNNNRAAVVTILFGML